MPTAPPRRSRRNRLRLTLSGLLTLTLVPLTGAAAPAVQAEQPAAAKPSRDPAAKPYMGWSSWSLQSTNYPGVNPDGPGSFINEKNILTQGRALATKLKPFGYEYINIDAGWQDGGDEYGRPAVNLKRFPRGIKPLADDLHRLGLKFGIYTVVGLGKDVYRDGNTPIYGTTDCFTRDIVYDDLRTTNGWDMSYKIDYSDPCAAKYAQSIVDVFAGWGVDFIKMDGVGPGSWRGGDQYDNREDVETWSKAIKATGRPMLYTLSWSISHKYAADWKAHTNGWRIDTDVECYCDTIVRWDASVKQRWHDVVQWIDDAGPGHWNNLDAINVGVGEMDGLTDAERQSYMTLWAISAAPLYAGDDLTKLDPYGLSLLTNREVITINQAGRPARPLSQAGPQQVWYNRNTDGSYTVALFNLANTAAPVTASWDELGIAGPALLRDVWKRRTIGAESKEFSATLPAHGSRLLRITPLAGGPGAPPRVHGTGSTASSVSLAWDAAAGSGVEYVVSAGGSELARTKATSVTIDGLKPSTGYRFTVRTTDGRRTSPPSAPVDVTTPAAGGPVLHEAEATDSVLTGSASRYGCGGCSAGGKVGYLGGSGEGAVAMTVDVPVAGRYLMEVRYTDGDTSRQGTVAVNGASTWVNFHGTGDNDWDTAQRQVVPVDLKAGTNTLTFANPEQGYLADIDAITI